jgi:hypothetical protein
MRGGTGQEEARLLEAEYHDEQSPDVQATEAVESKPDRWDTTLNRHSRS